MPATKSTTPLTEEQKAAAKAVADAEAAAAKAAAAEIAAITAKEIAEISDNIKNTDGRFDADYYGYSIGNMSPTNLKTVPLVGHVGNISHSNGKYGVIMTPSCGPFSECDYYRTSIEEDLWMTPGGNSVAYDDMPTRIREYVRQKREEKINIVAVKLAELDGYGNKKRATLALLDEFEKRKLENAKIRINCSVFDKDRKLFTYLGNLELFNVAKYDLKIPGTKNILGIEVMYFTT